MIGRATTVAVHDLRHGLRRPLFWIWLILMGLIAWGLSAGGVRISSGESSVGGTQAWITSQYAVAQVLAPLIVFYWFFAAVASGMTIIRDDDFRIRELIHATPLTPREYVWGKYAASLGCVLGVLVAHLGCMIFFNHVAMSSTRAEDIQGPFSPLNYLWPAAVFGLPVLIFVTGVAFWVGELSRRPILVFVLPVALLMLCMFFLWQFSPDWLDPAVNDLLVWVDPSGVRWLNETHFNVDKGVEYYNLSPLELDRPFIISRVVFALLGLLFVARSGKHFAASLRGETKAGRMHATKDPDSGPASQKELGALAPRTRMISTPTSSLASLSMKAVAPGLWSGAFTVLKAELRELRASPGLYLFIPLIVLQTVGAQLSATGPFDTEVLWTAGTMASRATGVLTLLSSLLIMFYTVESLQRDLSTGIAPITYATPVKTPSLLLGKGLANSLVVVVLLFAAGLTDVIMLAVQSLMAGGQPMPPVDLMPFAILWIALLGPTFLLWTAFVTVVQGLTANRYTSYAICIGALAWTIYDQIIGDTTWVTNWRLSGALNWSDLSLFEYDRPRLLMNRALALATTVALVAFGVRTFRRRDTDAVARARRLRPQAVLLSIAGFIPWLIAPVTLAVVLSGMVESANGGESSDEAAKDYWRDNVATWLNEDHLPDTAAVDVTLEIDPEQRWLSSVGSMRLVNRHDEPMARIPLTGGQAWEELEWTLDGEDYEPENRSGLYLFTPDEPLRKGQMVEIGFSFEGRDDQGTVNGGGAATFVQPSGVVLTGFGPSFVPVVGWSEGIGVDQDNSYESRHWPDDFHEGVTASAFGSGQAFTTRVSITGPEAFTFNSVGVKTLDEIGEDGRRTVEWVSDHPVRMFNVVGGRYVVHEGEGTAIYHAAEHTYNIDEMGRALDASRRYYAEWFGDFPWETLKLSEFPALATYAQGFATNITFSESIGFLTKSGEHDTAFAVTAHEAAHQWWGNLVTPGQGPGGNILSEGMAHYSTILLLEQVEGPRARIAFCEQIEDNYGNSRVVDDERAMIRTDGSKGTDQTVMYDKGGWVFWMLDQHLGRTRMLRGLQGFQKRYRKNRDHPVLQDFLSGMRDVAPDVEAFDAFAATWFEDVVVPEYGVTDGRRSGSGNHWVATVRVENKGSGTLPVEVAAVSGEERFVEIREDDRSRWVQDREWQESREVVEVAPGRTRTVSITCDFEPERIVVDPDATLLMLNRKAARIDLEGDATSEPD